MERDLKNVSNTVKTENELFSQISKLIEDARFHVKTAVNTVIVYTYYKVGSYIVNFEQQGKHRAKYGKQVLQNLSEKLTEKYEKGWSLETLKKARKFYEIYSQSKKVYSVDPIHQEFKLSWNHYQILMRIENEDERHFYEIESVNQNWSVRQLQRQYNSSLYERLALSKNKKEVMRLANEGQIIEKPTIGILLCKEKNDALVELTLPENANIYAQKYELYLPDKKLLQQKLKQWIEESEDEQHA